MPIFKPLLAGATLPDRAIACLGAAIGIGTTMAICSAIMPGGGVPAIVAPLGASAVLVFGVPASPLAQPWSVLGGNVASTLVGVIAYRLIPNLALAAGIAVGAAILLMTLLRCLHPPGGAAALTAVIGGGAVHDAGFGFALAPVGINSLLLVLIGIAFHRATTHSYPHRLVPVSVPTDEPQLERSDIDAALGEMHDSFDIDRADLEALLALAEHHATQRRLTRR
ncbi:CBS domain-containing membrane protein [Sphingomonas gellani]|uniref:CBS domain-containing membrane protein n=1 Tax=Sphingomonas gellani TaxID=1166340 RepID=A0A1H8FVQ2_9SPHN|nr:HPP family protein [Sphingomonas gellani]SEN35719.1 CBS domain-containing membrane protein [Sphingomonas gellani]